MKKKKNDRVFFTKVVLTLVGVFLIFFSSLSLQRISFSFPQPVGRLISEFSGNLFKKNLKDIRKFSSERDFKDYLEAASKLFPAYYSGTRRGISDTELLNQAQEKTPIAKGGSQERVSQTNVQVIGIDEPDIVKTDGKEIYFSGQRFFYPNPYNQLMGESNTKGIGPEKRQTTEQKRPVPIYPVPTSGTKLIKANPPADLVVDGKIDEQGDLLLDKNNLLVFSTLKYYGAQDEIIGYDVSSPKSPAKKWSIKLDNNTTVVTSRLRNGKIYLITRSSINLITPNPCPIKPLSVDDTPIIIPCEEIYHPIRVVPTDATFTAMVIDPVSGKVEKNISFLGSSGASVIYVSENAIYASYSYSDSAVKFFDGFIRENPGLFPSWLAEKVEKLQSYDISENSKFSELTELLQKYYNSLGEDDRLKAQNELQNLMSDYYKKHSRDLEKTGIIKIDLDKFRIGASGMVAGRLLNNFAIDEYQGNLRIATTIGSRWGIFNGIGSGATANDVYILDSNLKISGSVKDFGETEQIYAVRFMEDRGYVVTFRQTDPFFVLDLSNPKNPKMSGELKIPGYSSYLHPLDQTHILGIGIEGSSVKISLFDVSNSDSPRELDKYILDEYWTEVANNYHAFLLDKKHDIFFLPASKGGYVFSYKNNKLTLEKTVSQVSAKRAIYINDYLYIIGEDKISVLDESDWKKINELKL